MRLRPFGVDHLGGDELGSGLDQGGLLLGRQRQQIGSGECPRCFDADGANRIAEQRCGRINEARRRNARQGARRRRADERVGIAERRLDRGLRGRRGIGCQQAAGRSPARSPAGCDRGSADRAAARHRRRRSARHGVRCRNAGWSAARRDTSRRRSRRPIGRADRRGTGCRRSGYRATPTRSGRGTRML